MNLKEAIEEHGPVVAAEPAVGLIVCWAHEESPAVLTVLKDENMNGDYSSSEQYDMEGDNTAENAEEEAADVLEDILGEKEDDE